MGRCGMTIKNGNPEVQDEGGEGTRTNYVNEGACDRGCAKRNRWVSEGSLKMYTCGPSCYLRAELRLRLHLTLVKLFSDMGLPFNQYWLSGYDIQKTQRSVQQS